MFSIPGFLQVTMVVVSPMLKEATAEDDNLAGAVVAGFSAALLAAVAGEEEGTTPTVTGAELLGLFTTAVLVLLAGDAGFAAVVEDG